MWKKFDVEITEKDLDGVTIHVVSVKGAIDSSTFQELQEALQKLLDERKCHILVEFSELDYISSAGLGVLMGMLQEARQYQGELKLADMSPKIRNLFDMLGFSRLIRIYDDAETAIRAFEEDAKQEANPNDSTEEQY